MPPFAMKLLGGLGILAFAVVALILFGNSRYHSGQLAERVEWTTQKAKDTEKALTTKATTDLHSALATQESSDDLKGQLVDALAAAADRPSRVCGPAPAPHDLPGSASTAAGVADPNETAQLATDKADDAACAENTVKAQGWQDWWLKETAIPR